MFSILIADDDRIIRKGLVKIIESNMDEFKVVGEAANGSAALEKIKELKPDILITDIKMPTMDGIELINNIKKLSLKTRSIVLSGFDDYKFIRETFKNGIVDYILKPIDNRILFELLMKIKEDIENEMYQKEKEKEYKNRINESTSFLKEKFLNEILKDEYISNEYFDEKVSSLDILTRGSFYLAIIDVDDFFRKHESGKNEIVYLNDAKSIVYNLLKDIEKIHIIVSKVNDRIIVLFYSDNNNPFFNYSVLNNALNEIRDKVGEKLNNTLSIGISKRFDDLHKIKSKYAEAEIALKNRFYFGKNSTYVYSDESVFLNELDYKMVEGLVNPILNEVELCNKCNVKVSVEKFMKFIYEQKLDPDKFRKLLLNVMVRISSNISDFQYVSDKIQDNGRDISYYIQQINTYDELKEYFIIKLQYAAEEISKLRRDRGMKIIEKAKRYIQDNYTREITLKEVANYVYLNSNYFSELFKNEVGKNFIDYLIETRINASKELLKENKLKIYEVAEMVGYKEPVSFSRAFKKVVGVSPKEYIQLLN